MNHPRKFAQETPDKPAYIMAKTGEVVTYRQMEERANQCAHLFRNAGVRIGANVAVCMENNGRYLEVVQAAARAGLYYTCISVHLGAAELEYIINDCGAKAFITSYERREIAEAVRNRIPNVTTRLMVGGAIQGYESYEEKRCLYPTTPISDELEGKDMLYTSGTTGRPKGVVPGKIQYPLGQLPATDLLIFKVYGMDEKTVYLSPAPLYHAAPLRYCLGTHRLGGTAIVMARFDAEEFLSLIEKYRVTHTQLVPTMFVRMLKLPERIRKKYDLSSLKVAIHAAAPCPIPIKEQMIEWWGPIIYEYYAGTEANMYVMIDSEDWRRHKGSVGKILVGTLHILDDDENELPPRTPGTIFVDSPYDFEYHNDPEKTRKCRTTKGWTTLGDIGYLDEEGYLYLTDRKDDVIISGGVNIYPQEAENLLITHPKVRDAAVFGIPNLEFGEEVKAVVELLDPDDAGPDTEKELIAFCREHLSHIKCPKSIDFRKELPRTPTGKLFKRLLKEEYWKGHTKRIAS
jgi:long-chain acyl-CoA synthetase